MLDLIRLLCDTGLLILIWMTQLIVYPSFQYYAEKDLLIWHQKYTTQITIIVMPLMLGEIITASLQVFLSPNFYSIFTFVLIVIVWANTFFQAVPLHNKINQKQHIEKSVKKLIQINWLRTILWTIIFSMSVFYFFEKSIT